MLTPCLIDVVLCSDPKSKTLRFVDKKQTVLSTIDGGLKFLNGGVAPNWWLRK